MNVGFEPSTVRSPQASRSRWARLLIATMMVLAAVVLARTAVVQIHAWDALNGVDALLGEGRLEAADALLAEALRRGWSRRELHARRAEVQQALARWRGDADAMQQAAIERGIAAELNPLDGMAWALYGEALLGTDRPELALVALAHARERDPHNVFILAVTGDALIRSDRPEQAVDVLEHAFDVTPVPSVGALLELARSKLPTQR